MVKIVGKGLDRAIICKELGGQYRSGYLRIRVCGNLKGYSYTWYKIKKKDSLEFSNPVFSVKVLQILLKVREIPKYIFFAQTNPPTFPFPRNPGPCPELEIL